MPKRKQPAHAASQSKPTEHTVANPDRWDRSHGTYLTGRAAIDGADAIAVEMEAYWGVGRLRLLVPAELREKFDRQRYLFNQAIQNGNLEAVVTQSKRMVTGWMVCNQVAIKAGAKRLDPQVWEVALESGQVVAIVPDSHRAALVMSEGRAVMIYTLEEVGRMLGSSLFALEAKKHWPGATVEKIRVPADPLNAIDRPTGFDTPFDDGVPGKF